MGMRRQGYRLYAASLALLLLAACSSQDSAWGDGDEAADRRPLAVASLQAPLSSPQTRVTTSPLPADGEVGFFVLADGSYAAVNNKKGIYKADQGLWLPTDSIWLSRSAAKLALYYPYDAAQTADGKLNLSAMVRPADGSKDLSSARFEADSHTKDISLTLTQLYSRLSLTFVKMADVEYTGTSALTALKLEGAGVYATAAYSLSDAKYTYTTEGYTTPITGVTIKGTNAAAADATKVDLLLPPYQTLTQDLTLTATVDTKEMKIVIPKVKLNNTLTAGKQYNITVKLKPTALVLGSVNTTEWDSQTAFNEEAEMENPPLPAHAIEIEGLNFYVADGNVKATKQANNTYKYSFAEEQGSYSGKSDVADDPVSGDYFCWNTLDPALGTYNSTGVWNPDSDPCHKIGDGKWYTPTSEQLKMLVDLYPRNAVKGTYLMNDNITTVNGWYFGSATVPAPADKDKYVFLPFAGVRGYDSSANMFSVGSSGIYRSSTPSTSEVQKKAFSEVLDMGNSPAISARPGLEHYLGLSIRCVRDK